MKKEEICVLIDTPKTTARLVYVLLNTPDDIPNWEQKKNYSDLDKMYRIKTFVVNYEPEVIELLKNRVIESRNFLNNL